MRHRDSRRQRRDELHDLTRDPSRLTNLAGEPQLEQRMRELLGRLDLRVLEADEVQLP